MDNFSLLIHSITDLTDEQVMALTQLEMELWSKELMLSHVQTSEINYLDAEKLNRARIDRALQY